jgi:hypothetical protein
MFKGIIGNTLLIGITEDNLLEIEKENPLYAMMDELNVPFDIQIAMKNTMGVAIEGRKCVTVALSKDELRQFRNGAFQQIDKIPDSHLNAVVMYGRTLEEIQTFINSALKPGEAPEHLDIYTVAPGESVTVKTVDGRKIVRRRKAPASIYVGRHRGV